MIEMHMENVDVERLHLRQTGEAWIRAIMDGAPERLERFCQPDVASQLLTPKRYLIFDNAPDLVAKFCQWFGKCSDIQIEDSRVEPVGERLGIFYRFLLREDGSWQRIEQQLYCSLQGGRIANLRLLCSGFQPAGSSGSEEENASPGRDALLIMHTGTGNNGSTCALLTPAIKSKLREMNSGQVLEVHVDDPDARQDIEAWCRLSGNSLLSVKQMDGSELQFFVKKK